jgi:hypothetical protein
MLFNIKNRLNDWPFFSANISLTIGFLRDCFVVQFPRSSGQASLLAMISTNLSLRAIVKQSHNYLFSKVSKNISLFFLLIISIFSYLVAQDVELKASVNKNKVNINESFEYKVEVSGKSMNLPHPKFPSFNDLAILSGPNSSTSIQWINGKMSSSKVYTFYLKPQKTGMIKILPVTIDLDGKELTSNDINIEVVKGSEKEEPAESKITSRKDDDIAGGNLYLQTFVKKRSVYQNEQVIVTYVLYFKTSVRSYGFEKLPPNPGFWTEEFKMPSQPVVEEEIINGVKYNKAVLRKIALFPTQSGELTIEPITVAIEALEKRRSHSIFDSFFDDPFGRTVRKILSTKLVVINVKPVPQTKQPNNFRGDVGKFTLSLISDKTRVKANEAISIKLNLAGEGNIKLVNLPRISFPPDFEVYDPKEKTTIDREGVQIKGGKTIEYIVVPRFAGNYTIKPQSFSYFDPVLHKFNTLTTEPLQIEVLPGDKSIAGMATGTGLSKQEVELLGRDIRFIKEESKYYKIGNRIYKNWLYWFAYFIPVMALVFSLFYRRQLELIRSDLKLARRRKAGKIAARHLREAKKVLRSNMHKDFYRVMSSALQGFVSDKLNIQMTDFNAESVKKNLQKVGVGPEEIDEYRNCLEESDFRQFAGGKTDLTEMNKFYDRTKKILTRLEKYI